MNWKDLGFKAFWTGVAALAAILTTANTTLTQWWAIPLASLATLVLAYARQQTGETPPDLGTPGVD
jgi:hypothetical protein